MNIFYYKTLDLNTATLNEEESNHCTRVLRKTIGDQIFLFDGKGTTATGEIINISKKSVKVELTNKKIIEPTPYHLHVAIAPTKQIARIEWFIEKAIEFGIHEISFLHTKHSERKNINLNRLEKIALTAAKQSLSAYLPQINPMESFSTFIQKENLPSQKLIATLHEQSQQFNPEKIEDNLITLIGPEGGFTSQEVEQAITSGFQPILLGNKRLRAETAALFFPMTLYQKHF